MSLINYMASAASNRVVSALGSLKYILGFSSLATDIILSSADINTINWKRHTSTDRSEVLVGHFLIVFVRKIASNYQ